MSDAPLPPASAPPICGFCRQRPDPAKDILFTGIGGVTLVWCGLCGAILGATEPTLLSRPYRKR